MTNRTNLALVRKCNGECSVAVGRSHLFILGQCLVLALHHKILHQAIYSSVDVLRLDIAKDRRSDGARLKIMAEKEYDQKQKIAIKKSVKRTWASVSSGQMVGVYIAIIFLMYQYCHSLI